MQYYENNTNFGKVIICECWYYVAHILAKIQNIQEFCHSEWDEYKLLRFIYLVLTQFSHILVHILCVCSQNFEIMGYFVTNRLLGSPSFNWNPSFLSKNWFNCTLGAHKCSQIQPLNLFLGEKFYYVAFLWDVSILTHLVLLG